MYVCMHMFLLKIYFFILTEDRLTDFRERGRVEDREGEIPQYEKETLIGFLSDLLRSGTKPSPQAHVLTGNRSI